MPRRHYVGAVRSHAVQPPISSSGHQKRFATSFAKGPNTIPPSGRRKKSDREREKHRNVPISGSAWERKAVEDQGPIKAVDEKSYTRWQGRNTGNPTFVSELTA